MPRNAYDPNPLRVGIPDPVVTLSPDSIDRLTEGASVAGVNSGVADLAPTASATLVELLTTADTDLHGFTFSGTGNGTFRLLVGTTTVAVERVHVLRQSGQLALPSPLRVAANTSIRLFVTAGGLATATYEGSVLHG